MSVLNLFVKCEYEHVFKTKKTTKSWADKGKETGLPFTMLVLIFLHKILWRKNS